MLDPKQAADSWASTFFMGFGRDPDTQALCCLFTTSRRDAHGFATTKMAEHVQGMLAVLGGYQTTISSHQMTKVPHLEFPFIPEESPCSDNQVNHG